MSNFIDEQRKGSRITLHDFNALADKILSHKNKRRGSIPSHFEGKLVWFDVFIESMEAHVVLAQDIGGDGEVISRNISVRYNSDRGGHALACLREKPLELIIPWRKKAKDPGWEEPKMVRAFYEICDELGALEL